MVPEYPHNRSLVTPFGPGWLQAGQHAEATITRLAVMHRRRRHLALG
jgi:hypothetical protein